MESEVLKLKIREYFQIAEEIVPYMKDYVDQKYKESLRQSGKVGELIDVDTVAAIELLIEKNQWEKALETAKQKSHRPLLDKYLTMYAARLNKDDNYLEAIKVLERYGAFANPSNFNLYKLLFNRVYSDIDDTLPGSYWKWAHLRNMLNSVCTDFEASRDSEKKVFERYLEVAHYKAIWTALSKSSNTLLCIVRRQICISLLRYVDIINSEKAFYEAGESCKEWGKKKQNLAFLLLNHFLDLYDAIDQQDPSTIDTAIFSASDIPQEVQLPEKHIVSKSAYEEAKEWVLAASVDSGIDGSVLASQFNSFEGSLKMANGTTKDACIISGYPVGDNTKSFGSSGKLAIMENWNHLIIEQKTNPNEYVEDVLLFISKWTSTLFTMSV
uniref:Nuclear pore complex protein Nup85 n=1 Tax=Syphacia muris TaxID=451379 RepID=A0A0N5AAE4_9BILA